MNFTIQEDIKRAKQIDKILLPPFQIKTHTEIVCHGEQGSRGILGKLYVDFGFPRVGDYVFFDKDDEVFMYVPESVYEYLKSKIES